MPVTIQDLSADISPGSPPTPPAGGGRSANPDLIVERIRRDLAREARRRDRLCPD